MSIKILKKEIEAVMHLSGKDRYKYFIKKVVDSEKLYGLYEDGWALVSDDEGKEYFPLWPAEEYALLCAENGWENYNPEEIDLHKFLEVFVKNIQAHNISPAIFMTPSNEGITLSFKKFKTHLLYELGKYE